MAARSWEMEIETGTESRLQTVLVGAWEMLHGREYIADTVFLAQQQSRVNAVLHT